MIRTLALFVLVETVAVGMFVVAVVLHEFGHAAAARLLGLRVLSVQIGFGKLWWRRRVGPTSFELRSPNLRKPVGLARVALVTSRWGRARMAVVVGAGPAVNLLCAAVGLPLVGWVEQHEFRIEVVPLAWIGINLLLFAASIVPYPYGHGRLASDGLRLLRLVYAGREAGLESLFLGLLLTAKDLQAKAGTTEAEAFLRAREAELPSDVAAPYALANLWIQEGRFAEVAGLLRQLRGRAQTHALRAALLADLATADLLLAQPELADEALQCASQAETLNKGQNPLISIVYGAARIWNGEDGAAMLRTPVPGNINPRVVALFLTVRAQGEARLATRRKRSGFGPKLGDWRR